MKKLASLLLLSTLGMSSLANADVRITEWMYNTDNKKSGEFFELTNFGSDAVDFFNWSYDDDSRIPGTFSLASFGIVNPGESVIVTELDATAFRTLWNLAADTKVIGLLTVNLGREDEINIYNGNVLVDRLTYNDKEGNGPRTSGISGVPGSWAAAGAHQASGWVLSQLGDAEASVLSNAGDIGSPGRSAYAYVAAVPEPSTYAMLAAGLVLMGFTAYRRRRDKFKV